MQKMWVIIWLISIFLLHSLAMAWGGEKEVGVVVNGYSDKLSEIKIEQLANKIGIPDSVDSVAVKKLLSGEIENIELAKEISTNYVLSFPIKMVVAKIRAFGFIAGERWKEEGGSSVGVISRWDLTIMLVVVPLLAMSLFSLATYRAKKKYTLFSFFYGASIFLFFALVLGIIKDVIAFPVALLFIFWFFSGRLSYAFFGIALIVYLFGALIYASSLSGLFFYEDYLATICSFYVYSLAFSIFLEIIRKRVHFSKNKASPA